MGKPIDKFFNDISLSGLEGLAQQNQEDISSILKFLEETFTNRIEELKRQSVGNITRTHLLNSTDNVEFIIKAIVDEASLKTQTEFINHWIAKMILCQKTIVLLVKDLLRWCGSYKWNWSKYCENGQAIAFYRNRLFLTILRTYIRINGLCQNIGLAVSDCNYLYGQIKSNIGIKEKDFIKPTILDPETRMSERISNLNMETGNCLLINPEKSILGFAAVRMQLESFIAIKFQDKMRQNIRLKDGNNKRDVKYTSKLRQTDVFEMIKDILPYQKEYEALDKVYEVSSRTVHRGIPVPNYLSWGCWIFVSDTLRNHIDSLNPTDKRLENTMKKLENEEKLCVGSKLI